MTAVTVLLGSRLADLAAHGTRWRAVVTRWAADPRVDRLELVDFPRLRPGRATVHQTYCWVPGARAWTVTVPTHRTRTGPWDRPAWRATARALDQALGRRPGRLVVAATPLWSPLLSHLPEGRTAFDAVDDWRGLSSVAHLRARIDAGYRAAADADVVTSVSDELTRRLAKDFGLDPVTVPNGVELAAFGPDAPVPAGLPEGEFAVYVGSVEARVDLELLVGVARRMPVVVAGPAGAVAAGILRNAPGLTWLGPIDVHLVPGLLRRATVGLLPHHVDAFTASMDPMKLLEYLAAGLPVVATPLPGLVASPLVQVAPVEAFVQAAVRAARGSRSHAPDPAVLDRDWDAVADRLLTLHLGAA